MTVNFKRMKKKGLLILLNRDTEQIRRDSRVSCLQGRRRQKTLQPFSVTGLYQRVQLRFFECLCASDCKVSLLLYRETHNLLDNERKTLEKHEGRRARRDAYTRGSIAHHRFLCVRSAHRYVNSGCEIPLPSFPFASAEKKEIAVPERATRVRDYRLQIFPACKSAKYSRTIIAARSEFKVTHEFANITARHYGSFFYPHDVNLIGTNDVYRRAETTIQETILTGKSRCLKPA